MASPPTKVPWLLLGRLHGSARLSRIDVFPLPFRVGRRPGLPLTLPAASVSGEHAELYSDGDTLRVRDLGSTNGTFVNRKRVKDHAVHEGDILHFADFEFQLTARDESERRTTAVITDLPLSEHFVKGTRELGELLRQRAVTMHFQSIVELPSARIVGYEALGRGVHSELPEEPTELFRIAVNMGAAKELSRLFRAKALELLTGRTNLPTIFLNTHPSELSEPDLLDSLGPLSNGTSRLRFALEIHEAAVLRTNNMAELKAALQQRGIGLAYDDFGAGQARLLELGEVPPDHLKFDAAFIRAVDKAPESKRRMLRSLVEVARDLGVHPLAEGVETSAEAEVCVEVGFTHAQGYYFHRPVPLDQL